MLSAPQAIQHPGVFPLPGWGRPEQTGEPARSVTPKGGGAVMHAWRSMHACISLSAAPLPPPLSPEGTGAQRPSSRPRYVCRESCRDPSLPPLLSLPHPPTLGSGNDGVRLPNKRRSAYDAVFRLARMLSPVASSPLSVVLLLGFGMLGPSTPCPLEATSATPRVEPGTKPRVRTEPANLSRLCGFGVAKSGGKAHTGFEPVPPP